MLKTYSFQYRTELWIDGEKTETLDNAVISVAFRDAERESLRFGNSKVYVVRFDKETKSWAAIAVFIRGKEVSLKAYPYSG